MIAGADFTITSEALHQNKINGFNERKNAKT